MIISTLVIISHCRDEIIYFYDYIDRNALLVLVTIPTTQKEKDIFNQFISESGSKYIQLEEPNTFDMTFQLSNTTKQILQNLLQYKPNKIITQAKATIDSDIVSRKIYDFINENDFVKDKNNKIVHYIPKYNITNKKVIPKGVKKYAELYANGDEKKLELLLLAYSTVEGLKNA
jgi:hypothetical protein